MKKQIGRLKAYRKDYSGRRRQADDGKFDFLTRNFAPPASSGRSLEVSSRWKAHPAGGRSRELTGQISVSVEPDRLLGRSDSMAIVFSQQFDIAQADGSRQRMPAPEWMFSVVQDAASRDLSIVADNMTRDSVPRIAKVPQVFYPGSWSSQNAYCNRLEFENGDLVDNTLTVLGQEHVETGSGVFCSWVARISSNSASTGLIEGMDWWTPELAAPAKFSTTSRMPDGSEMRFVATLEASSVR